MKALIVSAVLVGTAGTVFAQTGPPPVDADIPGLTASKVLHKDGIRVGLQETIFGGAEKLVHTGVSVSYGIAEGWEADLRGDFARNAYDNIGGGTAIGYGGSDGELVVKFGIPDTTHYLSIQAGVDATNTPAQPSRVAGVVGISMAAVSISGVRLYLNPKLVALRDNTITGIGVGGVYDVSHLVKVFADWTPIVGGDNAISTASGGRQKVQLYSAGLRFDQIFEKLDLDLAITNLAGQTTGFSLTPSLGNVAGLYIGLGYRF